MTAPRILTSSKAQFAAANAALMVVLVRWAGLDTEIAAALVTLGIIVFQAATAYEDKVKVVK